MAALLVIAAVVVITLVLLTRVLMGRTVVILLLMVRAVGRNSGQWGLATVGWLVGGWAVGRRLIVGCERRKLCAL